MVALNQPTATYGNLPGMNHVFISSHIHIKNDNTGFINKPFVDYDKMKPVMLKYTFNKGTHRFNVHRYTKFSYFNKDELVFLPLEKWDDPYETLFYVGNDVNNNLDIQIACLCCTFERVEGEEAAWKRSTYNCNEPVIRISYDYNAFCSALEQIANLYGVEFYITIADYSNSIEQLKRARGISFTSKENYINYLTLKRKAFAYENELRIFVVGQKLPWMNNEICKFSLPKVPSLYDAITLPPLTPLSKSDSRPYSEVQFLNNLSIRQELEKYFLSSQIHQCHLYELGESSLEKKHKSSKRKPNKP